MITQQQALEALFHLHEVHGFQEDYEPLATLRQYIEQGAQPGADALRELAAAKRNLDFESNARNHGSAPEAMLAALAAKKRFDAALNAVLAAPQPQQEREQEQSK